MKPNELSVVLTGATGGVGAALARQLVARGARVLLVARTAAPLAALARALAREDDNRHRVDALAADVTSTSARRGIRDAAIARNVNALINAASCGEPGPLQAMEGGHIDAVLQTNLVAPIQLTRSLLPHLLQARAARVLSIGATPGRIAPPGTAALTASQAGLRSFCTALRRDLADTTVRVQFLGRSSAVRESAALPDYVAGVALRMLLAGSSERLLHPNGAWLDRLDAMAPMWLNDLLDRSTGTRRRRKTAPT
ncbi:MAG TPA: SDR family NAD(P)-dependent oxidoreductase [Burkholderiaceae bacterium]|nr:SDR family NAD(P)-dependent oxidoreductase [Burkholderiaceae bacterium]